MSWKMNWNPRNKTKSLGPGWIARGCKQIGCNSSSRQTTTQMAMLKDIKRVYSKKWHSLQRDISPVFKKDSLRIIMVGDSVQC